MGEFILDFFNKKLKSNWKIAFFSTIILGLIVHIYKFTNTLPNHDSLYNYYATQNVLGSGRWLLSIACGISSYFDLPWINGLLSIIYLGITMILLVEIFDINNKVVIILISSLLVGFPSIVETFFFGFTADGYILSMLLATLTVYLSRIDSKLIYWIFSGLCLCFACGIYQAYLSYAMILALTYLILKLIEDKVDIYKIIQWSKYQIILYVISVSIYWVIWKISLKIQNVQINSYQGIDKMSLNLKTILHAIIQSIKNVFMFFFEWNVFEHGWSLYSILNLVFIMFLLLGIIGVIVKQRIYVRKSKFIMIIISLFMFPFVISIWCFTSQEVGYRPMMLHSIFVLYVLTILIYEKYFSIRWKNILAGLLTIMVINNFISANIAYFFMVKEYETSYSTGLMMLNRIQMLDAMDKEIAIIGNRKDQVAIGKNDNSSKIHIYSALLESDLLFDSEHVLFFMNNTFNCNFSSVKKEKLTKIKQRQEVLEMKAWPASDSIQLVDDTIVIKLSSDQGGEY